MTTFLPTLKHFAYEDKRLETNKETDTHVCVCVCVCLDIRFQTFVFIRELF